MTPGDRIATSLQASGFSLYGSSPVRLGLSASRELLNDDFRELLFELSAAQAEFLIVGAYALSAHGLVRATGDLDVWVRPSAENAAKVHEALLNFGAPSDRFSLEDLKQPNLVIQIGLPPVRVDILTGITGVTFDEAWPERLMIDVDGLAVPVLSRVHLIQNKRAVGRDQDLVDIRWLEENGD